MKPWTAFAIGVWIMALIAVAVRPCTRRDPVTVCPTTWQSLVDGNGQVIGQVCYKPDGSRRIIVYR